jgi:tRNA(Ile)-lysidine synthase
MALRVELAFRRAAEPLIPEGARLLVAVSGGSDSMALLDLLDRLAPSRSLRLTVAHLDHDFRRGSKADRTFVERASRERSIECVSERLDVASLRRRDESLEEAARRVRRAFLLRTAKQARCELIATGHNLDDQAETILMRLVRGAGARALTGMASSGPGPFVRPLLGLEKQDLRDYLTRRRLAHREDSSNRDLRFDRNRVRQRILPMLCENLNPRSARHLVKAADRLREDAVFLDEIARDRLARHTRSRRSNRLTLDAEGMALEPDPIAKRLARIALQQAGADPRRVTSRHVDSLLDLASGDSGRSVDLPGRIRARRGRSRLILER